MKSINQTRHSMGEDSIFLMFESSDESDDSYDAGDVNDVDCNIYQELYIDKMDMIILLII